MRWITAETLQFRLRVLDFYAHIEIIFYICYIGIHERTNKYELIFHSTLLVTEKSVGLRPTWRKILAPPLPSPSRFSLFSPRSAIQVNVFVLVSFFVLSHNNDYRLIWHLGMFQLSFSDIFLSVKKHRYDIWWSIVRLTSEHRALLIVVWRSISVGSFSKCRQSKMITLFLKQERKMSENESSNMETANNTAVVDMSKNKERYQSCIHLGCRMSKR